MKRLSEMQIEFVHNASGLRLMLDDLTQQSLKHDWHLSVDFEGVNLSRDGEICTGQFMGKGTRKVYVVDFVRMDPRLKDMLQNSSVLKLLFDRRNDADALGSLHGVQLQNVLCLQLAYRAAQRSEGHNDKYVRSLRGVLEDVQTNVIHESDWAGVASMKGMKIGDGEVFKQKISDGAMDENLLNYCAIDVYYFDEFKVTLYDVISARCQKMANTFSAERILEWTKDGYQTQGRSKALAPFKSLPSEGGL